jgi:hypothetical protein
MSIFRAISAAEEIPSAPRVLTEAAIWLIGQGQLDAARTLLACELTLEAPTRYAGTPTGGLRVTVVCPPGAAAVLLDEERCERVNVRKAIDVALPGRYFVDQLQLESASETEKGPSLTVLSLPASRLERACGMGTPCSDLPPGTTGPEIAA